MRWRWRKLDPGEMDPEKLLGLAGAAGLAAIAFFPFDRVPLALCWFRRFTGRPCLSCGGTRSFVAMAHGRFAEGFRWNPLAATFFLLVVAFLIYAAAAVCFGAPRLRVRLTRRWEKWLVLCLGLGAALLNWIYLWNAPIAW